ncbi:MAG: HAD-IA family hydrolase [Chloroflexi bacterium]|nr:HAD-IA family hydrolase [Chloroflexota bacterium]
MIKAVLLDLDSSLLDDRGHQFAVSYRRAFAEQLEEETGIKGAEGVFQRAIQKLNGRRDMVSSNDEVMAASIAAEVNAPVSPFQPKLWSLYQSSFEQPRRLASAAPEARQLVEALLEQGLAVAVVSNPIYREAAIVQALQWAGLGDLVESFAFVSSSENMHFAKGDPAFYAELIARIGIEPDEALLVGDKRQSDDAPAEIVGLHTWPLENTSALGSLLEQVQNAGWEHRYSGGPLRAAMLKPQFLGNLGALFGLLSEVKAPQWHQKPDPNEWSIVQILCHLAETETAVHQKRLQTILRVENPFIRALPPPGPDVPICSDRPQDVAQEFRKKRLTTLELIADLAPEDWLRPARHSIFGLTNLLEMAYFTAQHDRLHVSQLCQTLGKCLDPI